MHNSNPPITHANLSGDTIFIQHNGLIKIGSIAPDIVNAHVKTCIDNSWWSKNRHFLAPELNDIYITTNNTNASTTNNHSLNNLFIDSNTTTNTNAILINTSATNQSLNSSTAVDIYAFGMVALEVLNILLIFILCYLLHRKKKFYLKNNRCLTWNWAAMVTRMP